MANSVIKPVVVLEDKKGIRTFSDSRIQEAIDHVYKTAEKNGWKNGVVFQVDIYGNMKLGFSAKLGNHFSFGGFLEKPAKGSLEGKAEAVFGW